MVQASSGLGAPPSRPRGAPTLLVVLPALLLLLAWHQVHVAEAHGPGRHEGGIARRELAPDTVPPGFGPAVPATQVLWFFGAPETVSYIGQGETVEWLWWDRRNHTVEGEGPNADLFPGPGGGNSTVAQYLFKYNYTFDQPGEYLYHCFSHPEAMVGTVVVKPKVNVGGVTIPWYDGVTYGGASAIVEEGNTVTWQWYDELDHSLASATGDTALFGGTGANNRTIAGGGFRKSKTFTQAGMYLYLCAAHGESMRGNITVVPKGSIAIPIPPAAAPAPLPEIPDSASPPTSPGSAAPTPGPAPPNPASSVPSNSGASLNNPPPPQSRGTCPGVSMHGWLGLVIPVVTIVFMLS